MNDTYGDMEKIICNWKHISPMDMDHGPNIPTEWLRCSFLGWKYITIIMMANKNMGFSMGFSMGFNGIIIHLMEYTLW